MIHESPGSIRNQVGVQLHRIAAQVEQEDALGLANQTRFLVTLARPYLKHDPDPERFRVPRLDEVKDEGDLFERCNKVIENVLDVLAENNIYAWTTPEPGDATSLALKADAKEEEEAEA